MVMVGLMTVTVFLKTQLNGKTEMEIIMAIIKTKTQPCPMPFQQT